MRKIVKTMIFVPSVIILFIFVLFIVDPIFNEITLNSFEKQLTQYPLPSKTDFIEKESVLGKLNGNGNGMDFFTTILIKSDLPLIELKQYYEDKNFVTAKRSKNHSVKTDVIPIQGYKLNTDYLEHGNVYFNTLRNNTNFSGYYAVILYDGGYSTGFDLRGN